MYLYQCRGRHGPYKAVLSTCTVQGSPQSVQGSLYQCRCPSPTITVCTLCFLLTLGSMGSILTLTLQTSDDFGDSALIFVTQSELLASVHFLNESFKDRTAKVPEI